MTRIFLLYGFLLLSIFSFAQKSGKSTATIKTKIYCSHCLQCGSCGANINDHIREENKGISKVTVDSKENTITVIYDPNKTNLGAIRKSINAAGYDADESIAPAAAVNKLDGCCKKQ